MKRLLLLSSIFLLLSTGCEKEKLPFTSSPSPTPVPTPSIKKNTPPFAYAGPDTTIVLPLDSSVLQGHAIDPENNIAWYNWKQISGPGTAAIDDSSSLSTKVGKLQKGTYLFQLTVTDSGGLTGKSQVKIIVLNRPSITSGEIIIKDFVGGCPMGCHLIVKCLSCYVPDNKFFKVYLKLSSTTTWLEMVPNSLAGNGYFIHGNDIEILYAPQNPMEDWTVGAEVKITY